VTKALSRRSDWVVISRAEYEEKVQMVGGYPALTVFSTLTDPYGEYGSPRI